MRAKRKCVLSRSCETWLLAYRESLRGSFRFLPSVTMLGPVAVNFAMIHVDRITSADSWFVTVGWTFARGLKAREHFWRQTRLQW